MTKLQKIKYLESTIDQLRSKGKYPYQLYEELQRLQKLRGKK